MATVDTSSDKLTLFAAMSTSASQDALQQSMLKPEFFMRPTTERAWIPMNKSPEEALKRAHWGADERGEKDLHPKRDFRVFQIEFTAHGFGYFHLANVLTTNKESLKTNEKPMNIIRKSLKIHVKSLKIIGKSLKIIGKSLKIIGESLEIIGKSLKDH